MSVREKGILVHTLDQDKTTAYIKNLDPELYQDVTVSNMAVVVGDKGLATLCSEGVGWFVDDNGKVPVDYFTTRTVGYLDIPVEDIPSLLSDKRIDLSDFIRSFGSRLETNFSIWKSQVKKYEQNI